MFSLSLATAVAEEGSTISGPLLALIWGAISAVSLPIGAVLGMWLKPRNVIVAGFMAFGGGALLAALTLDLVQEGIHAQFGQPKEVLEILEEHEDAYLAANPDVHVETFKQEPVKHAILAMAAGLIAGGLLFILLDSAVNSKGGFLRKTSTAVKHIVKLKRKQMRRMIEALGRNKLFQQLPGDEIAGIADFVTPVSFKTGETIFKRGETGDRMFFISSGEIEVVAGEPGETDTRQIAKLSADDILGEMALVADAPRSATAVATSDVDVLALTRAAFDHVTGENPAVRNAIAELAHERLGDLQESEHISKEVADAWVGKALAAVKESGIDASAEDVAKAAEAEGSGAALGIWLGILLDGIPESLVIGASLIGRTVMSPSLLAGLFLSNMPEAMSSAVLMRRQNYSVMKVMVMWSSLVVLIAVGAYFGNMFFEILPPQIHLAMAGLAAGSMLVMIAQTMMPEAFHQGGRVTGIATLAGFLVAVLMKLLGGH